MGQIVNTALPKHKPVVVRLDKKELDLVEQYAKNKLALSKSMGLVNKKIREDMDDLDLDRNSIAAEMAVAKVLGLPYVDNAKSFHRPDLDHWIEVRMNTSWRYNVRISPHDFDRKRIVVVVQPDGPDQDMYILGWMDAGLGKMWGEYTVFPSGAAYYFAPKYLLRPVEGLQSIIKGEQDHA